MRSVVVIIALLACVVGPAAAGDGVSHRVEVSSDGLERVVLDDQASATGFRRDEVPFLITPDWFNNRRVQVGGLDAADVDGDGDVDVVVGCYHSSSYPPYPDWENLIYRNVGGTLEAEPSWISADERHTGDIHVAFVNDDAYPDVVSANGGASYDPSVVYFGGPGGPSTTPGWLSGDSTWTNYALPFDFDHDGDVDLVTANQGNSSQDPFRPMYVFFNSGGTLSTTPGWQSSETSIQNFLAFGDYDGDGWEDLAVSKWTNGYQSGIYRNVAGTLDTVPVWTTGVSDTDKGVAWADVDGNGWPDLALGHDPTLLYSNTAGALTQTWFSTAAYFGHSDLRFCDVDLDGDPDLLEIHFSNGQAHLYLNRGGVLDSAPSWTYDSTAVGTAVACGDISGDGMPDLILGFSGDTSVAVFFNQLEAPLFRDGFEDGTTDAWSVVEP